MKTQKRLVLVMIWVLLFCCSCGNQDYIPDPKESTAVSLAPLHFEKFDDFSEYCQERDEKNALTIFVLPETEGEYFIDEITMREGVYVSIQYKANDYRETSTSILQEEASNKILCTTYLFDDGSKSLKQDIDDGFRKLSYEGKDLYCRELFSETDGKQTLLGYYLSFLQDKTYVMLQFPANKPLEEWLSYTNIIKRVMQ